MTHDVINGDVSKGIADAGIGQAALNIDTFTSANSIALITPSKCRTYKLEFLRLVVMGYT